MEKSKRGPNLTKEEKDKIINLVLKYRNIIENKKTDAVAVSERNCTWLKIAAEFNATTIVKRDVKQLKSFYKNSKLALKKDICREKKERFKTGGGQASFEVDNNNLLLSVVNDEVIPLSNAYDSSACFFNVSFYRIKF